MSPSTGISEFTVSYNYALTDVYQYALGISGIEALPTNDFSPKLYSPSQTTSDIVLAFSTSGDTTVVYVHANFLVTDSSEVKDWL